MLLTRPQLSHFWRTWSQLTKRHHWDPVESDAQRHALLQRAGFTSLTLVDKLKGYDRVLQELAALQQPDNLEPQLREIQMPRTRLVYAIHELANKITSTPLSGQNSYLAAVMLDKHGHLDLDRLSEQQLEQLRNTLAARLSTKRRSARSVVECGAPAPLSEPVTENCPF